MSPAIEPRRLAADQQAQVWIADAERATAELVYTSRDVLLEAPNWAPDGRSLLLNGDGVLWRLTLGTTPQLSQVTIGGLPPINNDHVLDAARDLIYLSANDGHIYVAPVGGGVARRITHDPRFFHFLHGVSPDGTTLAFVELPADDFAAAGRLALIDRAGGQTRYPLVGSAHLDGPEYSPDGRFLYVNTEEFATRPGHAQLARLPVDGGALHRLIESDTVDWFPHLSPDGRHASYVSFPVGTVGHPADHAVLVRLVRTADWTRPVAEFAVFGGQGTLNVNSWAPDSRRCAFVAYPVG